MTVSVFRRLVSTNTATDLLPPPPHPRPILPRTDPFLLLAPQLSSLRHSLLTLLPSTHPSLSKITSYYFLHPSKQIRPLIVLLFSLATNGLGAAWHGKLHDAVKGGKDECGLLRSLSRPDVLNDWNPCLPSHTARFSPSFASSLPFPPFPSTPFPSPSLPPTHPHIHILPTQTRLAQIVEMMHTASLLHDDVIDHSPLRRGSPSAPAAFGNKLSVLAGNFVLGRASAMLARLGDEEVTALIAGVISDLVEGEVLQMKGEGRVGIESDSDLDCASRIDIDIDTPPTPTSTQAQAWRTYLQKTYLKTASLMAKGARAAVTLGGCTDTHTDSGACREIAYAYGRNLGIAFQLIDDALDYESISSTSTPTSLTPTSSCLGKPSGADLHLGLATAPALYAWEEYPSMGALVARRFRGLGDVQLAMTLVHKSNGISRTRALAAVYAAKAKEVIAGLPESEARSALGVLAERVVGRRW